MAASRTIPQKKADVIGCPQCDWINRRLPVAGNEQSECSRCGYFLESGEQTRYFTVVAIAAAALILLFASVLSDFVRYSAAGSVQSMTLLDAAWQLSYFHEKLLAVLVMLTVILIPFIYLVSTIWVYSDAQTAGRSRLSLYLLRTMAHLKPWLMADVFLLGALVSLVKISSLAEVHLLEGFWAFSSFVILLLFTYERTKRTPLWLRFAANEHPGFSVKAGVTAHEQGLQVCSLCHALNPHQAETCYQCTKPQKTVWWRMPVTTLALIIASVMMLIPAHWLPVMETVRFGQIQPATIIGGVTELWQSGDAPIAIIVFVASLVIPVAKILVLATLLLLAHRQTPTVVRHRLFLFKVTEWVGRWSMIDIFVVAILVALVRSGTVMAVYPGNAAISFAAAVVLTMLAAMSFDTRLFWREANR